MMFMTGYKQGKTSLLKILKDGTVDKIINSFSIVGLMVVGSMAATRVAVDTPLAIKVGEGVTKIQTVLNHYTGNPTWNYNACMVDASKESKYIMDHRSDFCLSYHWILYRNFRICRIIKRR